jgi:hypothetical protein
MFSLAEWKYCQIMHTQGGPIKTLTHFTFENYHGHHVFAELMPEMLKETETTSLVYRDGGGQGTGDTKSEATYKSISESLERWAYFQTIDSSNHIKFGFNIDSNSSGMAAFPGLTKSKARDFAYLEAIERWSIVAWWEEHLPIRKLPSASLWTDKSAEVFLIEGPWPGVYTVILAAVSLLKGFPIYAFAASNSLEKAIAKAKIELARNSRSIDRFCEEYGISENTGLSCSIQKASSQMEKRLLFFATLEGRMLFDSKCSARKGTDKLKTQPDLVVDTEIPGPWSKYATVWRCLFLPVSENFLNDDQTYFLF